MKRIYYQGGPPSITAGEAGRFEQGRVKPVADALAVLLLNRTDIRFLEETKPDKPKKEN